MEHELGYPSTSICTGPSTSYLLFEAPLVYTQNTTKKNSEISEQFSDDLYYATGVMLSGNLFSHSDVSAYLRLHLGSDPDNTDEIMKRFKAAGLHYHMKHKFGVVPGTAERLATKLWNLVTS
jgi:aspartate/methionine/tyrosine aminotransferase